MLGDNEIVAFIATTQPEKAKAFYSEALGLKLVEDAWHAIVFSAGGTRLHIQKVKEFSPLPFTALGWKVADIKASVEELSRNGVRFERYPELTQDSAGIWTTPDGMAKVCWFKDPDGNTLSLTSSLRSELFCEGSTVHDGGNMSHGAANLNDHACVCPPVVIDTP